MKKRNIALLLSAVMLVQSTMLVGAAEIEPVDPEGPVVDAPIVQDGPGGENPDAVDVIDEEPVEEAEATSAHVLGYRDVTQGVVFPGAITTDANYKGASVEELGLERKYDPFAAGIMPEVRNQGSYGTCYAFSVIGLAEIQQCKRSDRKDFNYSEAQFAYFNWHDVSDPLGGISNDHNSKGVTTKNNVEVPAVWYDGGNTSFSQRILANWVGVADESVMPYTDMSKWVNGSETPNISLSMGSDSLHLQNVRAYSLTHTEDYPLIKQAIKTYGAVGVSYYEGNEDPDNTEDPELYYNETNNCLYNYNKTQTNHAVILVGWDDDFPKENFNEGHQPSQDGAWLLRNSWGENDYSHDGYFWISYEDKGLVGDPNTSNNFAYAFDFNQLDQLDNNYQYDGGCVDGIITLSDRFTEANMFVAADNKPLKAASFAVNTVAVDYTVSVYTGCEEGRPESGTLASTVEGTTDAIGYYTVYLPTEVALTTGTRFSVVVDLKKNGSDVSAPCETNELASEKSWYVSEVSANSGESFLYYDDAWMDYGTTYHKNLRIKAFTGGNSKGDNPFSDVPAGKYYTEPVKWAYKNGITTGISDTEFGTTGKCSRGQMITFVWRASGMINPQATTCPFTDVRPADYFYKPVMWAIENNITTGTSATTFSPKGDVSRAQVVTFMWRSAGSPEPTTTQSPFTDVKSGSYYEKAVNWAVENGITTGTSATTFSPNDNCVRGQVVTFLYRKFTQ